MNAKRSMVMAMVAGLALVAGACGGGKSGAAPAGSGTAVASAGDGSAAGSSTAATPGDKPAVARALVLRHGPMTYVMDTPRNQLEKAGVALEGSGLVAAVRGRGITVTLEADEGVDGVILLAGGQELAKVDLEAIDGKETPADLLAKIDTHFGTTP